MRYKKHQVAITGMGIISANGVGLEEFWNNTANGISGIKKIESIDTSDLMSQYGGEVKNFSPERYLSENEMNSMDRAGQFAVIAAKEAALTASFDIHKVDPYRVGVTLGTSLGGILSGEKFHDQWIKKGLDQANPSLIYQYPIHVPADHVSTYLKVKGPKTVISNACAAGTNAIGHATDMIRSGKADMMFAGGVDPLTKLSLSGFNSLQALSIGHCSPYSKSSGINIGEGAAFLVLENLEHAQNRGARIYAEVLDYAMSADCYHQTAPDPAGLGATRSMKSCLEQSELQGEDLSYINGHGTGTPANDLSEPKAIKAIIKENNIPVSSTKSMVGHMLGAAGATEAVTSILALKNGVIPPTINFKEEARQYNMDFVPNIPQKAQLDVILSNSFAFGGNNVSITFGKHYLAKKKNKKESDKRVVLTGVGAIAGNASNYEEITGILLSGMDGFSTNGKFGFEKYGYKKAALLPDIAYKKFINPKLLRKMDPISKQANVAVKMALDSAKLKITNSNTEKVGLLFATGTGPIDTVEAFNRVVIEQGAQKANARLFPNTVMNAAAGNIGLNFKLKGPTSTICAGGVSAINALNYATNLIQQDLCTQVIVVSSDEFNEPMMAGMSKIKGYLTDDEARPFDQNRSGNILGEGSVAFVIESLDHAKKRNAEILGEVKGFGMTSDNVGIGEVDLKGRAWKQAMLSAIEDSGLNQDHVDYISSSASGHKIFDAAEANAMRRLFSRKSPLIGTTKDTFGETHGTAGFIGIIDALLAIKGHYTGIRHLEEGIFEEKLNYLKEPIYTNSASHVLINSFSYGGNYQSVVLSKYEE
ncbi:beta-ketoacyl-[acyl-carrier-protein] synthase family protein [Bacillus sp. Bos-x628]|uniref:beta-ketoacyl-[acyl-carrier-protein] synthase family protein n=1 Tax=Bacillus maqinnsis TaxID=3229854 RepID=UPI00338F3CBB